MGADGAQGGHFFVAGKQDFWKTVQYFTDADGAIKKYNAATPKQNNKFHVEDKPGMNITILGKVLILHNKNGQRIACGKIKEFSTGGAIIYAMGAEALKGMSAVAIAGIAIGGIAFCVIGGFLYNKFGKK